MRRVLAVVLLGCVTPLWGQSLGEVAAREKKRREALSRTAQGKPVPSFTEEDLKGRAPDESTKASEPPGDSSSQKTETDSRNRGASSMELADDRKRVLAESIRGRLLMCQGELSDARSSLKELETGLAALQPRPYYNMEAVRQEFERRIREARTDVETTRQRCDDIEDEGRRAGIPAGWIR